VVGELPYKQLANHVYGLIVFPGPAVYSNPYSNPPIGCSRAVTSGDRRCERRVYCAFWAQLLRHIYKKGSRRYSLVAFIHLEQKDQF